MTHTATHNAFCFTLFTLVGLAFGLVFTSSLASGPDYLSAPSATMLAPSQVQANPMQAQTPSMSQPCPADPAAIQVAL